MEHCNTEQQLRLKSLDLDNNFKLDAQIGSVLKSSFFHQRQLDKIWGCFSTPPLDFRSCLCYNLDYFFKVLDKSINFFYWKGCVYKHTLGLFFFSWNWGLSPNTSQCCLKTFSLLHCTCSPMFSGCPFTATLAMPGRSMSVRSGTSGEAISKLMRSSLIPNPTPAITSWAADGKFVIVRRGKGAVLLLPENKEMWNESVRPVAQPSRIFSSTSAGSSICSSCFW